MNLHNFAASQMGSYAGHPLSTLGGLTPPTQWLAVRCCDIDNPTDITNGRSHDTWTHADISKCSENGKERIDGYAKLYFVNPKCQDTWKWEKGNGFNCRVGLIGGGKPKGWDRKDITHRLITSNWNCCKPSDSACNANGKKKECDVRKTSFNYDPKK